MVRYSHIIAGILVFILLSCSNVQEKYGWDHPYIRYEAQENSCKGNCRFLPPSDLIADVQNEASYRMAAQMINEGDFVEWTCLADADGLVIRFSLPDSDNGKGTKGNVSLVVENEKLADICLDSYHAWQYKDYRIGEGAWYLWNENGPERFPRMKYDEYRLLLNKKILKGQKFSLVKVDNNTIPYTIDFVELEEVPEPLCFDDIEENDKVCYDPSYGPLDQFVTENGGKTIFIPEGRYEVNERIVIPEDSTKIIGAGIWHTEIYFNASLEDRSVIRNRGFVSQGKSHCALANMYVGTNNERRYVDYQSGGDVGMGIGGTWVSSEFSNLWIEHFSCAAWVNAVDSHFEYCRFRNTYADGANLSHESSRTVFENSDFRNNGDDAIASWSSNTGGKPTEFLIFRNLTMDLGWRAGALGIFGGRGHQVSNIHVKDMLEEGVRVATSFPGPGFSCRDTMRFDRILIERTGVAPGEVGVSGGLHGGGGAALSLSSYYLYDMYNINMKDITIRDSYWDAVHFASARGFRMNNIYIENLHIDGWKSWAIHNASPEGDVTIKNLSFANGPKESQISPIPEGYEFNLIN